jgi:hypothetical protein
VTAVSIEHKALSAFCMAADNNAETAFDPYLPDKVIDR